MTPTRSTPPPLKQQAARFYRVAFGAAGRELTRQMAHGRDAQFLEIIRIPNAREHEQLWRVDGSPAQDHFPADISLEEAEVHQSHFLKSQLFYGLVERHPVPATTMRPLEIIPLWRLCSQVLDRGQRRSWLAGHLKAICTESPWVQLL